MGANTDGGSVQWIGRGRGRGGGGGGKKGDVDLRWRREGEG